MYTEHDMNHIGTLENIEEQTIVTYVSMWFIFSIYDISENSLIKKFQGVLASHCFLNEYLYTINFAVNNKNSEVAPYLALSEIPNTTVKYLETIYDALDENIKNSKYGKQLKETIEQRKSDEENIE